MLFNGHAGVVSDTTTYRPTYRFPASEDQKSVEGMHALSRDLPVHTWQEV